MIQLHPPDTSRIGFRSRSLPPLRELDVSPSGRAHGKLNPECSVSSFRSFALQSHVHVDDINAEDAVRLMLAFYTHVSAPEGLLEEGGDVLHCEWGLYHCGDIELFHFEMSREFTEAGKPEENGVSRFTVGLHYRPTFTLRAIADGSHWCSSRLELDSFTQAVRNSEAYRAVATLPAAEVALEWGPV
jgi:hypothetical protein